ncbi:hypothetical protein TWF694_006655 [Orbilia ellipsospora]|uniref:Cytochrome P450 n=1 Tax=Orbilia ellipsospora TaxID=2528407 RepID=A0AAV9XMB1_9PEZI
MAIISTILVFAPLLAVIHILLTRYKPHLRRIPGPFVASFTDIWRLKQNLGRRPEVVHQKVHEKYGDLVRIGPNCISVGSAEEVKTIYGITRLFQKSEFYPVTRPIVNGEEVLGIFDVTSEDLHKNIKRPVGHAYAMSTLLDYEPYVDSTIQVLQRRLEELYLDKNEICDLGEWLHWTAFDVVGEMTFSRRLGFLEHGKDVNNVISDTQEALDYLAVIGQMPFLDKFLMKNPLRLWWKGNPTSPVTSFALSCMEQRLQEREKGENTKRNDFLSKFLDAADKYEETIPRSQITGWAAANVFAGSDTTAISLLNLMRYPGVLSKLRNELTLANLTTTQIPKYSQTNSLPYLNAVVKESLRLHPAVGILLERVVPAGGVTLCDQFIPEGTIVGCNPWVIHRDKRVYGPDANIFKPERWIYASERQKADMERSYLVFGSGKRTCIGKNISLLEIYKIIPWMVLCYEFELLQPDAELKLRNSWFVGQTGIKIYLRSRNVAAAMV